MATRQTFTEAELATAIQLYFESKSWKLYPEVVIPTFGGRVDLVGTKGQVCMAAECKKTFSYSVLEQLTRWRFEMDQAINSQYADDSLKGIPHILYAVVGGGSISDLKADILKQHRIGLITGTAESFPYMHRKMKDKVFDGYGRGYVDDKLWTFQEIIAPKIQVGSRRTGHRIIRHLDDDMSCATPGESGNKGGYMTPFKRTMNKVDAILRSGGEWHIQHIVDEINRSHGGHHYGTDTTAKQCIGQFIIKFQIGEKIHPMRPVFRAIET